MKWMLWNDDSAVHNTKACDSYLLGKKIILEIGSQLVQDLDVFSVALFIVEDKIMIH